MFVEDIGQWSCRSGSLQPYPASHRYRARYTCGFTKYWHNLLCVIWVHGDPRKRIWELFGVNGLVLRRLLGQYYLPNLVRDGRPRVPQALLKAYLLDYLLACGRLRSMISRVFVVEVR